MASPSWNHDDEGLLHAAHDTAGTPAAAAAAAARPSPTVHRRRALQPPPLPPWQRLRRALQGADPLAHIDCLGPLGPAARPSVLQPLARAGGAHAPSSLCRPQLALCGTQLADLPVDRAGHLQPLAAGVAQCHLHLSRVAVPHTGVRGRKAVACVARACLWDGARFHGSVQAIHPRKVQRGRSTDTWTFEAGVPLLLRCPAAALAPAAAGRGMQLYLELNVAHELSPEEAAARHHPRGRQMQDEVCAAWALLDLSTLPSLHAARTLSLPLHGGPLARHWTLRQCGEAALAAASAAAGSTPAASAVPRLRDASLAVTLRPVPPADTAAVLLPPLALAAAPLARVVSLYRGLLAEALGTAEGRAGLAPTADHVLAAFPAALDDPDLVAAFFGLWRQELARLSAEHKKAATPVEGGELRAAFRRCATAVWALQRAQMLPPPAGAGDVAGSAARRQAVQLNLQQHPAVTLSAGAAAWAHKPFCCSELRCGPLERLGATV